MTVLISALASPALATKGPNRAAQETLIRWLMQNKNAELAAVDCRSFSVDPALKVECFEKAPANPGSPSYRPVFKADELGSDFMKVVLWDDGGEEGSYHTFLVHVPSLAVYPGLEARARASVARPFSAGDLTKSRELSSALSHSAGALFDTDDLRESVGKAQLWSDDAFRRFQLRTSLSRWDLSSVIRWW